MPSKSGRLNRTKHPSPIVTQREVAAESGVSRATVSIVLNNAPLARYISPQTRERIQRVAKKLGYRPNMVARSLRGKRNHTVGVMVFDIIDPFCTPILRGIENALYQTPHLPILTDAHNERSRFEGYLEMLLDRHVEGLIIIANWLFVDVELLADLEKRNIPAVIIGRELRKISTLSATATLPSCVAPRCWAIPVADGAACAPLPGPKACKFIPSWWWNCQTRSIPSLPSSTARASLTSC